MSKIDRIMTIGLVIFWLVVLVLILFCVLIREYLYFKNYISELEKRNQKLETEIAAREKRLRDMRASDDDRFNYFNAVFAAMKDGIVVFKDDGELVLVNRAARAFLHIDKHIFFKSDKSSYGAFYGLVSDVCRQAFESATERRVEFQEGDRIFEVSALLIPDRYQKQSAGTIHGVAGDVSQKQKTVQEDGQQLVSGQSCTP